MPVSNFMSVFQILSTCSDGAAREMTIFCRSELNHEKLRRYLSVLCTHKLLETDLDHRYLATSKGRCFLGQLQGVMRTLQFLEGDEWGDVYPTAANFPLTVGC